MGVALELYKRLADAGEDKARARLFTHPRCSRWM